MAGAENCHARITPSPRDDAGAVDDVAETAQHVYITDKEAVICGIPERRAYQDENTAHNCDAMGCSTLEHVLRRVPFTDERRHTHAPGEGWQWVPKEPTETMIDAGAAVNSPSSWDGLLKEVEARYKAMLAAAPATQEDEPEATQEPTP